MIVHCLSPRVVLAGSSLLFPLQLLTASPGYEGYGGDALPARVREPRDVAADQEGNVCITDTGNHVVRVYAPN